MSVTKRSPDSGTDQKSFLFCPECSRSAPMEEGWSRNRRDGRREINCPNCSTVVVSQPHFGPERDQPSITA